MAALDGEGDVLETKSFRARAAGGVFVAAGETGILPGAYEPVEGHDAEVNRMLVEAAFLGVARVQDFGELSEHVDGDRVGSLRGVVVILKLLEERSEYGMISSRLARVSAGIRFTQVGEPLAHCQ